MSSPIEAKRALEDIRTKAKAIDANATLTNAEKMNRLDALSLEMKRHTDVLEIHANANRLMGGGESMNSSFESAASDGRAVKGLATPSIKLSPEMQQGLYMAAKSGQNLNISLKDAASSDATRTQLPAQMIGLVDRRFEPTRILDHVPSTVTGSPSVEWITHVSNAVGIGAPVISLGVAAAGGTFAAGSYFWKLTATNGGGETLASNELTATLTASQRQPINWTAIVGANGYRLYRGTAAGAENVLVAVIAGGATVTYTDLGAAGTNASVPTVDRTATASTVHAGSQFPETSLTTVATILTAKKIGIFTTVVDELFADFPTFASYTNVELQRQITDAENWQLINADGTGDNILGLLNVVGTLSRAKASTDTALDVLEQGITDLRNGPSFCAPDAIIIHPSTWSAIRRTKDAYGRYLLGDPGQSTVSDVWGIPVLQTTQIVPGTIVMGNLEIATQAFIREGVTLSMTNSDGNDFTGGKVKIRATERLALGISRPTALIVLTGF
ncbi:phage major capsid protein [Cryobacterium sp. MDB2-10]|uniref:phage major capsid protein n=1 Tax=Cryobacterium sp. MDB2-10 TaxID=1259177 RepID=UPI0010741400|nr:phage major capsid protein [Cryobacterium sp. MDB2-10]TFC20195.1 phage major capsid protein [Cryobacterium sp. MDB2-10]